LPDPHTDRGREIRPAVAGEDALSNAQLADRIDLYLALGGGFDAAPARDATSLK